ncbi:ArsO family NAD(P)H-dependent flavin-containing monooxygenase [Roseomonas sp. GC11]|uniref:ArsO family NAD(P)H-dependent flavin-containing monooxygenase n=1 Tax=Roseomonas sp. GC11 TaxID=2950546 RepID=UPI00210BBDED|nr:ArsO family NAD(P)H-dependent flavin-containing monooxygenase [Roseomonas sp. GC11]
MTDAPDVAAPEALDVAVIGGGQAGLAAGYFLRRTPLSFVILDDADAPGGAWQHAWDSLALFSPAQWSSLPGWPMPSPQGGGYPPRDTVVSYLAAYEARYALPVRRPVRVAAVRRDGDRLRVEAVDGRSWHSRAVLSATGTWGRPWIPDVPGRGVFRGRQVHSAQYRRPEDFAGQAVLVVGGGNSGAQILAEVSKVARTTWVTERDPTFLPDEVDGRILFERATARWQAEREGRQPPEPRGGLGDIVMVPPLREARARGALTRSLRPFARLEADGAVWSDGTRVPAQAIIWCTGFRPALDHLVPLGVLGADGRALVGPDGRAACEPQLWLLGYGDWTGTASATLAGITRAARGTVAAISGALALDTARADPAVGSLGSS